jgi:hypothetical protein
MNKPNELRTGDAVQVIATGRMACGMRGHIIGVTTRWGSPLCRVRFSDVYEDTFQGEELRHIRHDMDTFAAAAGIHLSQSEDGTWIAADDGYELAMAPTAHAALCMALTVMRERYRRLRDTVEPMVWEEVTHSTAIALHDLSICTANGKPYDHD